MAFPKDFVWGAATSAYQIEGGAGKDGAGDTIYDTFCRKPGAVFGGQSGRVSADHYGKWAQDIELMRRIGLKAYRCSINWARVLPEGVGRINKPGLDFYDRLVDGLLAAGIEPWVTLFHWDLPQSLQLRGGWQNREIVEWFGEYTGVVADRLSDRVHRWMTINEPQVFVKFGLGDGKIAPGLKLSLEEQVDACHNVLMAHGRSVQVLRARAKTPASVGWALVNRTFYPASESPADIEAARRGTCGVLTADLWNNTWYADPVFKGHYPEDGLRVFGADAQPKIKPGDMELISQKLDFYGVNIYDGVPVRAGSDGEPVVVPFGDGHAMSAFKWFITPEALRWGPRFIAERYKVPVYITENGISNVDWVALDGAVHDPQRIDYTSRYLMQLEKAIGDGADIRGYFHWSLLDNFEWAEGYKERFGLIFVDFTTGKRTLKDSANWYRGIIESNGGRLHTRV